MSNSPSKESGMKEAIQKSIEGEYKLYDSQNGEEIKDLMWFVSGENISTSPEQAKVLLDSLFWQCLGKALGWEEEVFFDGDNNLCKNPKNQNYKMPLHSEPSWKYHWHNFITALSEGQSPDDFFNGLLSGTGLVS